MFTPYIERPRTSLRDGHAVTTLSWIKSDSFNLFRWQNLRHLIEGATCVCVCCVLLWLKSLANVSRCWLQTACRTGRCPRSTPCVLLSVCVGWQFFRRSTNSVCCSSDCARFTLASCRYIRNVVVSPLYGCSAAEAELQLYFPWLVLRRQRLYCPK